MQKTHRLYAFLAGLMLALNCYYHAIEQNSIGSAAPTELIREARHEQLLTCQPRLRDTEARHQER